MKLQVICCLCLLRGRVRTGVRVLLCLSSYANYAYVVVESDAAKTWLVYNVPSYPCSFFILSTHRQDRSIDSILTQPPSIALTIPFLHQHHNPQLNTSNMKLTLPALASLLALPSTLALTTPPYTNTTTNGTITPPSRYYLQTHVKGSGNPDKNGLFVSGYHTGAGENDATLQSIDVAAPGYLNGTNQQFDLGTQGIPWGMNMVDYDYYAGMVSFPIIPLR